MEYSSAATARWWLPCASARARTSVRLRALPTMFLRMRWRLAGHGRARKKAGRVRSEPRANPSEKGTECLPGAWKTTLTALVRDGREQVRMHQGLELLIAGLEVQLHVG